MTHFSKVTLEIGFVLHNCSLFIVIEKARLELLSARVRFSACLPLPAGVVPPISGLYYTKFCLFVQYKSKIGNNLCYRDGRNTKKMGHHEKITADSG